MVVEKANPSDTVWLTDRKLQINQNTILNILSGNVKQIIEYNRHWSFLPMILKILLFLFVGYELFFGFIALPQIVKGQETYSWFQVIELVGFIGLWLIFGALLVIRPSINREARKNLRLKLNQYK